MRKMADIFGPWHVNDILTFHHRSKDLLPGKGSKEFVEDLKKYSRLASLQNWRKVLSNFHVSPFEYNGYFYNTIEHAIQFSKFKNADPQFAYMFTIDSGHEIGQGDGEIAHSYRWKRILKPEQLMWWLNIKTHILETVTIRKYQSCVFAQDVLNSTGNAELWSIRNTKEPVRFVHLESLRAAALRLPPRTPVGMYF